MDDLFVKIAELELPLQMDDPTPGRGNCLFAAICQQLRRQEIGLPNIYTQTSLRRSVCDFALALTDPRVIEMSGVHNGTAHAARRRPWMQYFNDMRRSGVFGEEPVLYMLAYMLGRDIVVISSDCTIANPWLFCYSACYYLPPRTWL